MNLPFISINQSMLPLKSLRNLLEITKSYNPNLLQTKAECLKEIERLEWPYLLRINDSVIKFCWILPWHNNNSIESFQLKNIRKSQTDLENEITVHMNDENAMLWWNDFSNIANKEMEKRMVKAVNEIKRKFPLRISVTSIDDIRAIIHSWLKMIETERVHLKKLFHEHHFFTTTMKPPILLSEDTLNQIDDHDDGNNNFKVCREYIFFTFGRTDNFQIFNNYSLR